MGVIEAIVPNKPDSRDRMIRSAALLFRRKGVEGTAFSDVIAHSGAPRGSIYHHFPGGKAELAEATTRYAGELSAAGLAAALREKDPAVALGRFSEVLGGALESSGYQEGCPIAAAALEGERAPEVRAAAGEAIASWEQLLTEGFEANGVEADRARAIATLAVAAIEGAIVVARAQQSIEPVKRVGSELERIATEALAGAN